MALSVSAVSASSMWVLVLLDIFCAESHPHHAVAKGVITVSWSQSKLYIL